MYRKLGVVAILQMLIILASISMIVSAEEGDQAEPQWPDSWIRMDSDPAENSDTDDYRDVEFAYYNADENYMYFRLECYGIPNFTMEPAARYKWFLDTDVPYNMYGQGGTVYEAEYLFFVEDSPILGSDGDGEIYLLEDLNNDGCINKNDYPDYLTDPGEINDTSLVGYRLSGHTLDMYLNLSLISDPDHIYFTWATDQEDPNLDSAPTIDRSNSYWCKNLSKSDISIVKTDTADPVPKGGTFTYNLTITNNGPHNSTNINVTDELPESVIVNNYSETPYGNNGSRVWWHIPSLFAGQSHTITINVSVNETFNGTLYNTAHAYNTTYDPIQGNNDDSEETTVMSIADLSIKKSYNLNENGYEFIAGDDISYSINITNNGPNKAEGINVTDILPSEVTFLSASQNETGSVNQTVWWNIDSLEVGKTITIDVNVTIHNETNGIINNTAKVSSTTYDPNVTNNNASVETFVIGIADLTIDKTSIYEEPLQEGSLIIYLLNISNSGPNSAKNVTVYDILPDELTFVNASPIQNGSNENESIYWWNFSTIDVNETIIIQINTTVKPGVTGTITNHAYVIDDSDPNGNNSQDNETIIIDDDTPTGDDDDDGNGGGGGGTTTPTTPTTPSDDDENPTADANGPYYGTTGEAVQFDGSGSHDNDENGASIVQYDWRFSDDDIWFNDTGATPSFLYSEPGTYTITLRVFDDEGNSDTNISMVTISHLNRPPSQPNITGPENGTVNNEIEFEIVSNDDDEDPIQYSFDWGDNTSNTSEFVPQGISFKASHIWTKPGTYTITVTADDNETLTTEEFTIEIEEPDTAETDYTTVLFIILPLLAFIILLIAFFEKRRKGKKNAQGK